MLPPVVHLLLFYHIFKSNKKEASALCAATGYREWEASNYLAETYKKLGYTLTTAENIPGFYTDVDTGKPGPKILVLSELDGLFVPGHPHADPETNAAHACGHHAQCAAHGPTYRIADFDSACMDSAKAQIAILRALLENGAEKAKTVLEHAKPHFPTLKDYTDYLDSLFLDTNAVEYLESGDVVLHL